MADRAGINLLPEEGREEERLKEHTRLLSLSATGVLLVVIGLTVASYAYSAYLKGQADSYKTAITQATQKLTDLKSVEVLDRTVSTKLIRLQSILATYPRNSTLLDDISAFTPTGVSLTSLTFDSTGKLGVSGMAAAPANFGDFVTLLKDPKVGGTKFSNVEIISVSGGGNQGDYRFSLSMTRKTTL